MGDNERIDHLERRVAFLESTIVKFMAIVLHPERKHRGKTKTKDKAGVVGSRIVLERGLNSALIDLMERAELTQTEQLALPDPKLLYRLEPE